MDGIGGVVLDVAAEADDEVVNGSGVGVLADAPDVFEDLLAGDDLAGAEGEVAEEIGLHDGEAGGAVRGDELEGVEADGAAVKGVGVGGGWFGGGDGRRGLPHGSAEEGLDADEEDVEVEGLGEVVVCAGLDAFEDVFGAGAGGEHEDGGEALEVAQGAGDSEAVGAGQHAVEDDGGDRFGRVEEIGEGGVAVGFVMGAIALVGEVEEQTLGEVLFVFDEGDEWLRRAWVGLNHATNGVQASDFCGRNSILISRFASLKSKSAVRRTWFGESDASSTAKASA